ncbi:uncharacterized protein LOC127094419 [Lathyrus oleraceus]|uniref:uncharacterized protein LOC127094419 n=1 Tax=Pisum sativum TaxID=3888 RepID=UPI0021CF9D88|nr:uncharacterized protein LOC127094419 [Pisum sativum]
MNVPFTEVMSQMITYVKFLKGILSKKRKLEEHEIVDMATTTSAVIPSMPLKLKDHESLYILCQLGTMGFDRELCNLGYNFSLIPLSVCKRLGIGEIKPINVSLLADRSMKYPIRVLEDVSIKVGNLYILIDFIIMDIKEDLQVPIIVGRSFLCTADIIIDVKGVH